MQNTELQEVNKKLDRILWYLEDDECTGRKGMYHRLYIAEKDVARLKTDKRFLLGIAAGVSFITSILTFVFSFIIKK